jgi:twitching motility protein PilJ
VFQQRHQFPIFLPLTNLSETTQRLASGNLDVTASIEGTLETRTLADNFNQLVERVKNLLQAQKNLAEQQRQEKEQLEAAIYTLIDEVSDATEGDLTVRANLDSLELSTVADLFNAIITNLQEIAVEAKHSTNQVGSSLKQNETAILALAEQAIAEAQETRDTLVSVEQMSQSIREVAENASQAEKIADDTYNTIVNSTDNMNLTVNSILELRNTVGETAKKMKRLGESSQKISQAVSFIEEIALKTNVLAINASVEAGRAGEYGQGFTIVAEQVGALAAQSATATKEIASIVAAIQAETQEVSQAMETGTTQVVESTRLVEVTKESLRLVLEKSQTINQLMESISQTTVSQAHTSQNVTSLMQKIAQLSETTSQSSKEVAQSIVATAEVAQKLESTVAQFKVAQ